MDIIEILIMMGIICILLYTFNNANDNIVIDKSKTIINKYITNSPIDDNIVLFEKYDKLLYKKLQTNLTNYNNLYYYNVCFDEEKTKKLIHYMNKIEYYFNTIILNIDNDLRMETELISIKNKKINEIQKQINIICMENGYPYFHIAGSISDPIQGYQM